MSAREERSKFAMESGWRASTPQDSRNKIVNRIREKLQRHLTLPGQEGMDGLWKIARGIEVDVFNGAIDEHDYLRKISLLQLETNNAGGPSQSSLLISNAPEEFVARSQVQHVQELQQQSGSAQQDQEQRIFQERAIIEQQEQSLEQAREIYAAREIYNTSSYSLPHIGPVGGVDQVDIVWTKMQVLKEKYLQDMNDLNVMLTTRMQADMPQEHLQKLTHFKLVLQRMIPYLEAKKESLPKEFKQDKVEVFEKQLVRILETFRNRKRAVPQPQQDDNDNASNNEINDNKTRPKATTITMTSSITTVFNYSSPHMKIVGEIDQLDLVWTKMQVLTEKYLQDMKDLNDMLATRMQADMTHENLHKLTHYKNVLQRMMPYLVAEKRSLPKEFKQEKVEIFEKQLVSIMETFRRCKRAVPQPQDDNDNVSDDDTNAIKCSRDNVNNNNNR